MSRSDQKQAMHEYLDALLLEDEAPTRAPTQVAEAEKLERLLAQATLSRQSTLTESKPQTAVQTQTEQQRDEEEAKLAAEFARAAELEKQQEAKAAAQKLAEQQQLQQRQAELAAKEAEQQKLAEQAKDALVEVPPPPVSNMKDYQEGDFQALFFSVAGLKLAVPLKSLGGIHQWKEPNTIFGKPAWYLGIMTNREEKLNVVDTAMWVMPEKYNDEMAAAIDYQYLIMLGESHWGLACENLVTTETLSPDDIQWRKNSAGKRPWLAGVVREKMCAILDVDAMVEMLEQGLNSQDAAKS